MARIDLVKQIAAISGQMPAVAKKKDPTAGVSYAFRNVDAILDAVSPLLAAAGLVQFTEVLECQIGKEEGFDRYGKPRTAWTAFVRMALVVTDGESEVRTVRSGFSMDYGDKAVTQAEQMALKYAVTFLYGVKTGDRDPDSESNAPLHTKPVDAPPADPNLLTVADAMARTDKSRFERKDNGCYLVFADGKYAFATEKADCALLRLHAFANATEISIDAAMEKEGAKFVDGSEAGAWIAAFPDKTYARMFTDSKLAYEAKHPAK